MSNSLNTPVEALEHAYPFHVTAYGIRRGSGGAGEHRGGDGLRRDLKVLAAARVALLCERRTVGPSGARGGKDGATGENVLIREGVEHSLAGKATFSIEAGDIVSIRSPGGGGWGDPTTDSRCGAQARHPHGRRAQSREPAFGLQLPSTLLAS